MLASANPEYKEMEIDTSDTMISILWTRFRLHCPFHCIRKCDETSRNCPKGFVASNKTIKTLVNAGMNEKMLISVYPNYESAISDYVGVKAREMAIVEEWDEQTHASSGYLDHWLSWKLSTADKNIKVSYVSRCLDSTID